jgi:hypothetical protein
MKYIVTQSYTLISSSVLCMCKQGAILFSISVTVLSSSSCKQSPGSDTASYVDTWKQINNGRLLSGAFTQANIRLSLLKLIPTSKHPQC